MGRAELLTLPAPDFCKWRARLVLAGLCLLLALAAQAQKGAVVPGDVVASERIRGQVTDAVTGEPLAAVNVALPAAHQATVTDAEGYFTLVGVPAAGQHTLRVTRIGYEPGDLQIDGPAAHSGALLSVTLVPAILTLREITVTPGAFRIMDATAAASHQSLSRADIEASPQFSDDIFRAIHRMPGLAAGDFAARFSIRGGRADETLILLDGLEIYEPYHMKDFNEGAISIVDVETIDGVELMTGGFPVQYGNRRSGVFHIHSRTPHISTADQTTQRPTRHSVGLSVMNLRAMSEGAFGDGRGSWFVSGRRGYLDLALDLMGINDIAAPVYYDLFGKVTWQLSPNQDLAVRVLHAGDSFEMDEIATTGFQDTIDTHELATNSYGNSYAWASLTSALSERITVETMAHAGLVTRDRTGSELFTELPDGVYDLDKRRDLRLLGLKQDWLIESSASLLWNLGVDLRQQEAEFRYESLVFQDPNDPSPDLLGLYPVQSLSAGTERGTLLGAYASGRVRLIDPVTVEAGLRYDRASHTDDSDLSPRLSARFDLPTGSLLRLGWGQYRQMHDLHDETALDAGGRYEPSELSKQWTAGVEHEFSDGTGLRVEAYHKSSDNPRPVYRNWVAGALDVFPETNEDLILVDLEQTSSRGLEAYLTHDRGRHFAWRASYALSQTRENLASVQNINVPDDPLPFASENDAPQDQRHAASVDLIWRPNPQWTINLAAAYHSGWPITIAIAEETRRPDGTPDIVARPQTLYGSRLPAYHRVDVRLTRRMRTTRGDLRLFLELINLTNRENVFAYDYERDVRKDGTAYLAQDTESWFPLLPSVGMTWSW